MMTGMKTMIVDIDPILLLYTLEEIWNRESLEAKTGHACTCDDFYDSEGAF